MRQITGVPSLWRRCGLFFSMMNVPPGMTLSLSKNLAECPDPRCGGTADVFDGVWQQDVNGALQSLDGPEWTREQLRRLQVVLQRARRIAAADPVAARACLDREAPTVARRLGRLLDTPAGVAAIGAVGAIVAALIVAGASGGGDTTTVNETSITINEAPQASETPAGDTPAGEEPPEGPVLHRHRHEGQHGHHHAEDTREASWGREREQRKDHGGGRVDMTRLESLPREAI